MTKALRKATGNTDASDEFLDAWQERAAQREAERDARLERMHRQTMRAIKKQLRLIRREFVIIRWIFVAMAAMFGVGFPTLGILIVLTH